MFAVSDDAVVEIAKLLFGFLTPVFLGILSYFSYKAERSARRAEAATEAVAVKLESTESTMTEKIDDVAVNVEHGVKLNNSTLLASTKLVMEADERMANSSDATDEDRFRAAASKKHYLRMVEEQKVLGRDMEAAAEKRAAAKLKAASLAGSGEELAELKQIKEHTGKMADRMEDAVIEVKDAVDESKAATAEAKDVVAERDKTKG